MVGLRRYAHRAVAGCALAAAVAAALAGCADGSGPAGPGAARTAAPTTPPTTTPPTTTTSPTGPATPPVTAVPGRVAVYLLVPVRAVPADGRSFPVTVIIDNATGHAVPTGTCPDAAAGLSSARVPFEPVYPAVGCTVTPTYPPGVTRLARSVSTAYQLCVGDGGEADATMPRCTGPAHSTMPPLPAGRYQVRFDTNGVPGAVEPDPVFVTLVRP